MYPRSLFSRTSPFPRTSSVFVAISFDASFDKRWVEVLEPALSSLSTKGKPLDPIRVDLRPASDAILTEILTAISDSHCIVADITSQIEINGRPIRNANVMYEVGLAHAVRLPEEVILFRSDHGPLDFDIAGVRVHSYSPDDNPVEARKLVAETVLASLKERDLRRIASIRTASERLTHHAMVFLLKAVDRNQLVYPNPESFGDSAEQAYAEALASAGKMQAIGLLLELGALRAVHAKLTPELINKIADTGFGPFLSYAPTPFGRALLDHIVDTGGGNTPEFREHARAYNEARRSAKRSE